MSYSMPNQILKDDLVVLYANRQTGGFAHKEYFVGVKKVDFKFTNPMCSYLQVISKQENFIKLSQKKEFFNI